MNTKRFPEPDAIHLTAQQRASVEPSSEVPRRATATHGASRRPTPTMTTDVDEDLYDDVVPGRMPKSVRRYRSPDRSFETEPHGVVSAGRMREQTARTLNPMEDQFRYKTRRPSSKMRNTRQSWKPHWVLILGLGMLATLSLFILGNAVLGWYNQASSSQADAVKYGTIHGTEVFMDLSGNHKFSRIQSYNHNGKIGVILFFEDNDTKAQIFPNHNTILNFPGLDHAVVDLQVNGKELDVIIYGDWKSSVERYQTGYTLYVKSGSLSY